MDWIKKTAPLSAFICLLIAIIIPKLFPIINGEKYNGSIPVFQVLLISVFISYVFAPNVSVMMAAKRHKTLCLIAFISFIVNILLSYYGIRRWGAIAASVSVVVSNLLLNLSSTIIIFFGGGHNKKIHER